MKGITSEGSRILRQQCCSEIFEHCDVAFTGQRRDSAIAPLGVGVGVATEQLQSYRQALNYLWSAFDVCM